MTDDKAGERDTRPGKPKGRARADKYQFGVEKGQAWVRGDGGFPRALPSEIKKLRQFWRTTPGRNMFWFPRAVGWQWRDYLYIAMQPWKVGKLHESAKFWAALGLESDSEDVAFLSGFVDGALGVAGPDLDVV